MHRRIVNLLGVAFLVLAIAAARLGAAETQPVNLNTASAVELATIKGIGPSKAQAIIEHREKNGAFKSVDDLKQVRGIGDKMLEQLRTQVTVGEASNASKVTQR
jgi:competence protein ComEA